MDRHQNRIPVQIAPGKKITLRRGIRRHVSLPIRLDQNFMAAFTPHAAVLQGDMPNYTDIEPVIQINEVLISR